MCRTSRRGRRPLLRREPLWEELRRRQLAAVTNWAIASAKVQPVVLALEDIHWADPTTLDLLRGIAERGALAPLFVLITARPEFRPPWGIRSHHGMILLAPLDRQEVRDMVSKLAALHVLSNEVVEGVSERTGGVPLFVEEVTRLLLERGEQGGIQAIPPTLQQSLTARLDRLGPARDVAQIGAAVGRGFSYALIRAVVGMDDRPLQVALERLAEADILLVQGLPPDSDYRFKHVLIQDAAYENLLKSRRQALHRRVAEILRDRFADTAAAEPEVLAHHFTQAALTDAAIEWWGKAGDQALRRSAFQEAIAHLGKAIEMADKSVGATPQTATPGVTRAKLQTSFGNALIAARGHGAPETTAAFARARELAAAVDDPMERLSANYGLWVGHFSRGEAGPLRAIAEIVLRDIEGKPPSPEAAIAHRLAGVTEWYFGNFELARSHLEQTLAMFDPQRDRDLTYRFGQDMGVSAMVFIALSLWPLGETERARLIGEQMLARATASGHMLTTVFGHFQHALLHVARRDAAATAPLAEAVVKLAREHDMPLYRAYGEFLQPWSRWHLGDREGGLPAMRRGIVACRNMGNLIYTTLFDTALAEAEAEAGEIEAALASIDHAIALTERTGQRWNEADIHRARGEILLKRDPANTASAEEAFLTAIAIAHQQKAKSFELRAALSLAKLYQSIGRASNAHAVLAPALEWFSATSDFPEIEQARALLAVLAANDEVKSATTSRQFRLQLQNAYGQAVMYAKGYTAPETSAALARARQLAAGSENPTQRLSVHFGFWINQWMRGELAEATISAASLLREAKANQDLTARVVALRMCGACDLFAGDFAAACQHFDELVQLYDPTRHRDLAERFGIAIGGYSLALWALGEMREAAAIDAKACAQAEAEAPAPALANFYTSSLLGAALRRDRDVILANSSAMAGFMKQSEMQQFAGFAAFFEGVSRRLRGEQEAGLAEMERAAEQLRNQGVLNLRSFFKAIIAGAQAERGEIDAALASVSDSLVSGKQTGERWFEAEAQRIQGDIALKGKPFNPIAAEEAFLAAINVAQQQRARIFELRATTSMARLWRDQGKRREARELLAPVYCWFTEGFGTRDLKEAKALLDELAA
jgi:predicted ATPase